MENTSDIQFREAHNDARRRATVAAICGHVMEWFDFAVFGYLAVTIGKLFFPADDPTASLLSSLASFGVGFLARPLGGIVFGYVADRHGRKALLLATFMSMALSTLLVGLLPTHDSVGVLAPVLLVVCRIAQGISAGGESTGAIAFLIEWAPESGRGKFGSLHQVGSALGLLLGSLSAALLNSALTQEQILDWGWRVPFIIAAVLGPLGLWLRAAVDESPAFKEVAATHEVALPRTELARMACRAFALTLFWSVGFYFFLSYMPTFAQRELHLPPAMSFWVNAASIVIYIFLLPLAGHLSDKVGRRPVMIASCIGFALLAVPLCHAIVSGGGVNQYLCLALVFAFLLALYAGPAPATLAEGFPTRYRATWMAVGYNIATLVFGGFTPFLAVWLAKTFSTALAPVAYVSVSALVSGICIMKMKETAGQPLK